MHIDDETVSIGSDGFRIAAVPGSGLTFSHLDWPSQELRSETTLPYPHCGFGGAVLSISQSGMYAAAILYSGQSEIGYELFSLSPELRSIGGLGYVGGESDLTPIRFSPCDTYAAIAILESPFWWCDPDDDDADWDSPSVGGRVDWATLYLHTFGDDDPIPYRLVVDLPRGWVPPEEAWPAKLTISSSTSLSLSVPWADEFRFSPRDNDAIVVPSPMV